MLDNFGELGDCLISEIVLSIESVNYFELMTQIGVMIDKKLIDVRHDKARGERVYSLLPDGKVLADEFTYKIPLSIREKTLETGRETIKRIELEKSIRCYINYDYKRKRYDLCVRFLNEVNGDIILDVNVFAPDEKRAMEMKERFLKKPSFYITRMMNMFLKDDFFMYDK